MLFVRVSFIFSSTTRFGIEAYGGAGSSKAILDSAGLNQRAN